jgi:hypothetical protein
MLVLNLDGGGAHSLQRMLHVPFHFFGSSEAIWTVPFLQLFFIGDLTLYLSFR